MLWDRLVESPQGWQRICWGTNLVVAKRCRLVLPLGFADRGETVFYGGVAEH